MTTQGDKQDDKPSGSPHLPFVTVKYAQTLDGRMATATGDSQWISGPDSLRLAHQLRAEHDAILVGVGTVLADDPQLNVRLVGGRDPLRVIVDSRLRTPSVARVLAGDAARHTLIATTDMADRDRRQEVERLGAQVVTLPTLANSSRVDLASLLGELKARGVQSVLVEGGPAIITSLLAHKLVDRLVVAIAPKLIGSGREAVGDLGIRRLADALTFERFSTRRLGDDIIFDGRIDWRAERPAP
ncbi:MAG TPA: bifunctional diaminohydroxyphosphoribosylaminopyrimidine deaminase/5-amino-6-(5-phosphoribosylamino)uracil reductase RibD [Blastocatellia bacterium]|nr:bifunctional diaminohydroxyphosphoribosylaminopyrimidine deaminase/5-amino-6-(5-phosphoribosylamino)uracil reductase RibD [Blastocatellia bacterium]